MPRKNKEAIKELMEKHNVDDIYSWSKYSLLLENIYSYFLKYILKKKPDMPNNAYGYLGGLAHDILEKFYLKKINYDDMIIEWKDAIKKFRKTDLKFDRNNESMNKKIENNYISCMNTFFVSHKETTAQRRSNELFIYALIGKYLFQGYIDCLEILDGIVYITDYKTSTMYKGDKLTKNQGQLLLYAIAIHQITGIPYDKIRIRWNFLKYVDVSYMQKNGKEKKRTLSRKDYVYSLRSIMTRFAKELKYDDAHIETIFANASSMNEIDILPKNIRDKFTVDDCYVYVEPDLELINNFISDISGKLDEINDKKRLWKQDGSDSHFWKDITEDDLFFLVTLGDYSSKLHKPLELYFDKKKAFNEDNIDEVLAMLDMMGGSNGGD